MIFLKINSDPRKEIIRATHLKSHKLFKKQLKLLRRYRAGLWVQENYLARELERNKLVIILARKLFKRVNKEGLEALLNISTEDINYLEEKEKKLKGL